MTANTERPLIGLPADLREADELPHHSVGEKYIGSVAVGAGGMPMAIPSLGTGGEGGHDIDRLVDALDGLLVTGSRSNVMPAEYGGPPSRPGTRHDPARDATTLPLIRAALADGVPVLALCRGMQEFNVALGGTLHQNLQDLPGNLDHRADPDKPVEERYDLAHEVALAPGGMLAGLAGATGLRVNSLHAQGIDRLASGLAVEATAPDGVIEAVRVENAPSFALAIQWHPEWRFAETEFGQRLFAAFGDAARARRAARRHREFA